MKSATKAPKQNTVLETTRTRNILKYINSLPGFKAVKRHQAGANRKGDPDITGCGGRYGRHIELEVKQPGNRTTTLQEIRLREWSEVGAVTGVVHDVDDVISIFKGCGLIQA